MSDRDHFPFPTETGDRPGEFTRRQADAPLDQATLPSGCRARIAVRYADVLEVFSDPGLSRELSYPGAPRLTDGGDLSDNSTSMLNMDPPRHTRLRRLVAGAFTPRRIERWRPRIRQIAEDLLADLAPPADLVDEYAFPLPVRVICELLGVPDTDRDDFRAWSDAILSLSADTADQRETARTEFTAYVSALIDRHRHDEAGGLLGDLITAFDADAGATDEELTNLTLGLILAGHETTSTVLSRGVFTLLRHPAQYAALAASPDLVPNAVEEILRYDSPGNGGLLRVAKHDLDLPSGPLTAGEAVIPCAAAANRDPAKFDHPTDFDITRPTPDHLTFGRGTHYCLGANLARTELQEALTALTTHLPTLRLVTPHIPWRPDLLVQGPQHLPITW